MGEDDEEAARRRARTNRDLRATDIAASLELPNDTVRAILNNPTADALIAAGAEALISRESAASEDRLSSAPELSELVRLYLVMTAPQRDALMVMARGLAAGRPATTVDP